MKLKHKLLILFLGISLLICMTGLYAVMVSKRTLQDYFLENATILAKDVLQKIDMDVLRKIEILEEYSMNKQFLTEVIRSNQEFDKMKNMRSYISRKESEWTSYPREEISPFMKKIINSELSGKLREKTEFFEDRYGYRVFGEIFATNKHGVNIAQTGKTTDYRQDDEEWWQVTKRDGLYLGDVRYDSSADMYSIAMGVRINDREGNFMGALKAVFAIEQLENIVKSMNLPLMHKGHKDMHFRLITEDGKIIVSTKMNEKFLDNVRHLLPELTDRSPDASPSGANHFVTRRGHKINTELLITLAHARSYRENKGPGWILIMEHEKEEIFAPIIRLRNHIVALSLAVAVFAVMMIISLSAYITKSFRKLREYTEEIGMGNLETTVDIKSKDEFGQLAHAVQKMTEDLKTTTVARNELAEEMRRRKHAENMILEGEERFRSVAESAHDAIIYMDSRGEVVFWNRASERIFGYRAEEVVGKNVTIIMPERFHDGHRNGIEKLMKGRNGRTMGSPLELYGLKKDGTEFPLELSLSSWKIRDELNFTAIIRDISDRKSAQEMIQNQLGRLDALRSIDRAIIASLDLNVTLDVFLSQLTAQLGIDAACVLLMNNNTQLLEYVISKGFRSSALKYTRLRLGESNAGRAATGRSIVTIPNLGENMGGFESSKLLAGEGFVSYIAVPLIAKGQVRGVLELFHRSLFHYKPGWLEFLEAIANQGAIAIENSTMFDDLQRSNANLICAYDTTIEGWSRALDLRYKETKGHSKRVTEMTIRIAKEFQIKDEELVHIRRGALLHDIGKMGIPDKILLKSGKLTNDEWITMKLHPIYARDLLYPIEHLRPAIEIPYFHHERWDGSGYPEGLKSEDIPLSARIFAVVDVWDALRSGRPYMSAWPEEKVRDYIRSQAGILFDPRVVEVFLAMVSTDDGCTPETESMEDIKHEKV
jgi:PAS domain S-box-containing protein